MKDLLINALKWIGLVTVMIWCCRASVSGKELGQIEGVLQTSGETPLANANIMVENTSLAAVSSATGRFSITGVPPGQQTILARLVGYQTVQEEITVQSNTTANLTLTLTPTTLMLPPIVVTGTKSARQIEGHTYSDTGHYQRRERSLRRFELEWLTSRTNGTRCHSRSWHRRSDTGI